MKKVLIVLVLLSSFVYASSANVYVYESKPSSHFLLTNTVKILKNLYVDVDFARMFSLVDSRFENEDFLNAPKGVESLKPLCMFTYTF
jgi:hypothetical protein